VVTYPTSSTIDTARDSASLVESLFCFSGGDLPVIQNEDYRNDG
jgi:hypothetical protein